MKNFLFFALLFVLYAYPYHGGGWNQNSRLDLLHAVTVHGTLSIDRYHGNTGDKALIDDHYYSDKAPGIALLAFPSFVMSKMLLDATGVDIDNLRGWRISEWITTVGTAGLLAALGGTAFLALLASFIGLKKAILPATAVFLGSSIYPYSTALFSHGAAAGLLAIALWIVLRPRGKTFDVFAGLCCGFAIASEYVAVFPVLGLLLYSFAQDRRRPLLMILGCIGPMLLIPLYNYLLTGDPFHFAYENVTGFEGMKQGFFGFRSFPDPVAILNLLFGETKGLFVWSPFLLMAIPGWIALWKENRRLFWLTCAVPCFHLLLISCYFLPGGGAGVGPRHLVSIIPFLGLPAGIASVRYPRISLTLAAISIAMSMLATLLLIFPPDPPSLILFYLQSLWTGDSALNLGKMLGLQSHLSLLLPFIILGISLLWMKKRA